MAHCLVELYHSKPAWLALDQGARAQFFEAIGAGMADLTAIAVWRAPDESAIGLLVAGIAASG